MKKELKERSRILRQQGKSIRDIANILGVAKSSVSVWVNDIVLTKEQIELLTANNFLGNQDLIKKRAKTYSENFRNLRLDYQKQGRILALEKHPEHIMGCMLYWAEGSKSRHTLGFVNCDADMMLFFVKFLRKFYQAVNGKIKVRINCYLDQGLTISEIEDYWLNLLDLNRNSLYKSTVCEEKLKYGTCAISISNVKIVQSIFGSIQEYAGINKQNWLG